MNTIMSFFDYNTIDKQILSYVDSLDKARRSSLFPCEVNPVFGWGCTILEEILTGPGVEDECKIRQEA